MRLVHDDQADRERAHRENADQRRRGGGEGRDDRRKAADRQNGHRWAVQISRSRICAFAGDESGPDRVGSFSDCNPQAAPPALP